MKSIVRGRESAPYLKKETRTKNTDKDEWKETKRGREGFNYFVFKKGFLGWRSQVSFVCC